jgi:acetyltransferase-like isoleucine patch superfamily enzyme
MIRRLLLRLLLRIHVCARHIGLTIRFLGRRVTVHPTSWVSLRSAIRVQGGGAIFIGRNCEIHPYSMVLTYGGIIRIGDNCSLNPFSIIYGHGGVRIGNGVRIAAHTVIIPANHNPSSETVPFHRLGTSGKGIVIDDDVWLGAGSCILDGAHISRNAIVGAGSVVTKSIPANVTVAGVPARIIAQRPTQRN